MRISAAAVMCLLVAALTVASAAPSDGLSATATVSVPGNDACSNAIGIGPTGGVLVGTTVGSTTDSLLTDSCGTSLDTTGGVWYTITPANGAEVVASTCDGADFDTKLAVFANGCDVQTCVTGVDDSCDRQSTVSWTADGSTYLIYVTGYSDYTGDFDLSVTATLPIPGNDVCSNAIEIAATGGVVAGTTVGSTTDSLLTTTCVTSLNSGVWYTITPAEGSETIVSTCGGADYDTKLAIFADGCDVQSCVTGVDDSCDLQSTVSWTADGSTYLVYVTGYSTSTGEFVLTANVTAPVVVAPENDVCSAAVEIASAGGVVSGTTVGSTTDSLLTDSCVTSLDTAGGVWYTITPANGAEVVASTCDGADFDTKLAVFADGCDVQTCVTGVDDSCDRQSTVSWTADGSTYLIYVTGYSDYTGDFDLTVTANVPAPENDVCSDAMEIATTGGVVVGTTVGSTTESLLTSTCGTSLNSGVWYAITPAEGTEVVASTCGSADYDTKLAVFADGCDTQTCVTGVDDSCGLQSTVSWTSDGSTYLIYVTGYGTSTGNFVLDVEAGFPGFHLPYSIGNGRTLIAEVDTTAMPERDHSVHFELRSTDSVAFQSEAMPLGEVVQFAGLDDFVGTFEMVFVTSPSLTEFTIGDVVLE